MAGFSRAALPDAFYDIQSSMLLAQPEPQFLYAVLFMAAMGASLNVPIQIGLPGRGVSGVGSDYSREDRDRLILSSPLTTELFAVKADFNAAPGTTIRVNRPVFTDTTYTEASRLIASGSTISTVPVAPPQSEQNNITIQRFGGPYDSANNRVAPHAIEAFDANMGIYKASTVIGTHLRRDFAKWLDAVHVTIFDKASTAVYPDGMSAVNDATAAGSFPFTYEQLARAEQLADQANLPTFSDGFRIAVLTTLQVKQLKDDPTFTRYAEFHKEYNTLFQGQYCGSVGKMHLFKSTTLNITNNSSSVPIHYGHLLVPGVLMGGMGRPPRVIPSTNDNYGETILAVWLADLAFKLADSRFAMSLRSSA